MHIEDNPVVVAYVQSAVTAHEAKRLMLKALLGQSFQVAHLVGVHQCFSCTWRGLLFGYGDVLASCCFPLPTDRAARTGTTSAAKPLPDE
ncbi:hypothetical protein [Pseudomonas asiatica]|uniref:hypothetical protein n=1 Tax=Pseudomonas asiatica TaxID=2219225 RepID=UPI0010BFA1F1|nr:hypothetical protein [Pseudomonas asiatica]